MPQPCIPRLVPVAEAVAVVLNVHFVFLSERLNEPSFIFIQPRR